MVAASGVAFIMILGLSLVCMALSDGGLSRDRDEVRLRLAMVLAGLFFIMAALAYPALIAIL